jgi:hypothetical protein
MAGSNTWLAHRMWSIARAAVALISGSLLIAHFAWNYRTYPYLTREHAYENNHFFELYCGIALVCIGLLAIGFRYWLDKSRAVNAQVERTSRNYVILPQPFLKPFPDPRTVFADPVARYERRLNALVSIDLSTLSQDLSGWIHLVSPIEPYDGLVGQYQRILGTLFAAKLDRFSADRRASLRATGRFSFLPN